jgi:hypothetical protein
MIRRIRLNNAGAAMAALLAFLPAIALADDAPPVVLDTGSTAWMLASTALCC